MVVSRRPENPMTADHLVKLLQMTGAALAIPAAAAAGLVGTAGRNERSDQAAEQAADRRLRPRARNSRRERAAVGRGRPGIMLVSKGLARVRMLDPG